MSLGLKERGLRLQLTHKPRVVKVFYFTFYSFQLYFCTVSDLFHSFCRVNFGKSTLLSQSQHLRRPEILLQFQVVLYFDYGLQFGRDTL